MDISLKVKIALFIREDLGIYTALLPHLQDQWFVYRESDEDTSAVIELLSDKFPSVKFEATGPTITFTDNTGYKCGGVALVKEPQVPLNH